MAWSEVAITSAAALPHELLDDGFAPEPCELLVIGCGNILRGDDAVGPVLIRHLFTRGVPDGVRLVDGGTAGMDVAFGMRGAARVVIVDASATGAAPGTIYRVPAEELGELPPIDGLHTHNFRWDHALSFSAWLLGPQKPTDITVFLVEAGRLDPGAELSEPVAAAMNSVMDLIEADFYPARVEITEAGYLHVPARLASRFFPGDTCVARMDGEDLVLMPLVSAAHGGLVLKQCNVAGDRSLLVNEVFAFRPRAGAFDVIWDAERGALRVLVGAPGRESGEAGGDRDPDRGGRGARPVGGLPAGADAAERRPPPTDDLPNGSTGTADGRRGEPDGGPQTTPEEGTG